MSGMLMQARSDPSRISEISSQAARQVADIMSSTATEEEKQKMWHELATSTIAEGIARQAVDQLFSDRRSSATGDDDTHEAGISDDDKIHELVTNACKLETELTSSANSRPFEEALRLLRLHISQSPESVNHVGDFEVTSLHTACGSAAPLTLRELLVPENANLLAKNCFGQTPFGRLHKYAKRQAGAKECAKLLVDYLEKKGIADDSAPRDLREYGKTVDTEADEETNANRTDDAKPVKTEASRGESSESGTKRKQEEAAEPGSDAKKVKAEH